MFVFVAFIAQYAWQHGDGDDVDGNVNDDVDDNVKDDVQAEGAKGFNQMLTALGEGEQALPGLQVIRSLWSSWSTWSLSSGSSWSSWSS